MCPIRRRLSLLLGVFAGLVAGSDAPAQTVADARIALHVVPRVSTKTCTQNAPTDVSCTDFNTRGDLSTAYTAYVVIGAVPLSEGTRGVTFGVVYDGAYYAGLDVTSWQGCTDLEFASSTWPLPTGGIAATWAGCQAQTSLPGAPGGQAVVGAFSVLSYDPDSLQVSGRNNIPEPYPAVSNCDGAESDLIYAGQWAVAAFGGGAGYNPCGVCQPCGDCVVSPSVLNFGSVILDRTVLRILTISNPGTGSLNGNITESCPGFTIKSGGGPFTLAAGNHRDVAVEFQPSSIGPHTCEIQLGTDCGSILAVGTAVEGGPDSQENAVIALHSVPSLDSKVCLPAGSGGVAPDFPCGDFLTQGDLETSYFVYIVVAGADPDPGIAGVSLGLNYAADPDLGVDVLSWTPCADLQFPSASWPAPSGGLIATWSPETNCQREVPVGADGAQAVVGVLHVIAYQPDQLAVTGRNSPPEPNPRVADCSAASSDLVRSTQVGMIGFGGVIGFNPCRMNPVPVEVLEFSAHREGGTAVLAWRITEEAETRFHVHVEQADGGKIRVFGEPVRGSGTFRFVDPHPPLSSARYWLEALARDGSSTWFGPVTLDAATRSVSPVLANRPNPFQGSTVFLFRTETEGNVVLSVFDLAGREVARVQDGAVGAGEHRMAWDARDAQGRALRAGVYLYRITTVAGSVTRKLVLLP